MMNLNLIAKVLIICLGLLEAVSSTPTEYTASDGQKYLIEFDLKFNWLQALHKCASEGYQLIVIDSEEKNTVIIDLLKEAANGSSVDLWTGGNDEFSSKVNLRPFFWSATGEPLNFTNWAAGNPYNNKRREHCAHISSKSSLYQWHDYECDKPLGFICEVSHFKKTFNNDLKHTCDVVKNITSSISDELNQAQQQLLSEIDSKIQDEKRVGVNWRAQIKQLEINTQMTIQKKLDEQQQMVRQMIDEVLQQVVEVNLEIANSAARARAQSVKKINEKQDEINKTC